MLILDLQLRHGTGFGVLRSLGDDRPAVIVFTNYALPEYRRRAEQLGAEYFLNKSLEFERLPEVIRDATGGSLLRRLGQGGNHGDFGSTARLGLHLELASHGGHSMAHAAQSVAAECP